MFGNQRSTHIITTRDEVVLFDDVDPQRGVSAKAEELARLLTAIGIGYTSTVVSAPCATARLATGFYGTRRVIVAQAAPDLVGVA